MAIVMTERVVTRREVAARGGMVTAKHPLVAEAGVRVLQDGGNAIDAAVAMAFATGVAEPLMSGLGGGGFMTIAMADGRRAVVDYQVRAPLAAHETMYELTPAFRMDGQGFVGVADDANYSGHRAAAVPGLVSGLYLARERFGTRGLDSLLAPAIALAEDGYPVSWYMTWKQGESLDLLRRFPQTARVFLNDGLPYKPLQEKPVPFRQPDLAATLRRIAAEGPDGFYRGPVARAIAEEMARAGGHIAEQDLARYQAKVVEPVTGTYRGIELIAIPAPASGALLLGTLNLLEPFDLPSLGHNSVAALHLTIEAMRRSHADRFTYLGDPEFQQVPMAGMTAKAYADVRRPTIDLSRHVEVEAGDPWAFEPGGRRGVPVPIGAEAGDGGCTTTLAAVDAQGNAVAITQTITSGWGCGVTVPGTGVLLNNAMTLFDPRPGMANSIQPGKRPASSMAHTIALRDGQFIALAGAPGGRRILDTCTQVMLNVLDHGLGIQDAVSAPLVDTSDPASTGIDARIPEETRAALEAMGHRLAVRVPDFAPRFFASPAGITRDPATGELRGGADPYAEGVAAGY
jgi:gamma-glutamyltranspeptidase / glutathione hydrolase